MAKRNAKEALSKVTRGDRNTERVLPPVEPSPGQSQFEGLGEPHDVVTDRAPATEHVVAAKATAAPKKRAGAPEGAKFVGLVFPKEWWNAARAAFVADFYDDKDGRASDTFGAWAAEALRQYVARTTDERAELAEKYAERSGVTVNRQIALPIDVVERLDATRYEDGRVTRRPMSRSASVALALIEAADATRKRCGGQLPPAPDRLPTRGLNA